jgi:hypothetical protein
MSASDDYPRLAEFAHLPSSGYFALLGKRREAERALDEIDRLRRRVASEDEWETLGSGVHGDQPYRIQNYRGTLQEYLKRGGGSE